MTGIYGQNSRPTLNIGKWMAAKIYSDIKTNTCECGGKYSFYQEIKRRGKESIFYPVCELCQEPPAKFRIRAKLADQRGRRKYVFIRKTLGGRLLDDVETVLDVFKRVEEDENLGKFRFTDYDKKEVRTKDLFKNVVAEYIRVQSLRNDLSPYSLDSKKKYSKKLVEYFGDYSVHDIEGYHVEDYKLTLTSHSNQVMCLGEMKTILNWAEERYKILKVPKFEVPSSKKRKKVPDLNITRDKIIPAIENEVHRIAIHCLEHYGLRPSEVRAIQYEQIDLIHDRLTIDRHFSKTTLLMGRKSAKEGEDTANLDRPLSPELKAFIKSRPWPLDKKTFVFTNTVGKPLGVKDLSQTWRETLKKLKLPHVELYGLRGAKITEVLKETGGDMMKARDFAGHTDIKTTMSRYDHSDRNVDDLFKKTK